MKGSEIIIFNAIAIFTHAQLLFWGVELSVYE